MLLWIACVSKRTYTRCDQKITVFSNFVSYVCLIIAFFLLCCYTCLLYILTISAIVNCQFFFLTDKKVSCFLCVLRFFTIRKNWSNRNCIKFFVKKLKDIWNNSSTVMTFLIKSDRCWTSSTSERYSCYVSFAQMADIVNIYNRKKCENRSHVTHEILK